MNELDTILERADNIVGYLLYGTDADIENSLSYHERLLKAKDTLFSILKAISPETNQENDTLVDAIMDFSMVHNEVYLEIGLIIGMYLSEKIEKSYRQLDLSRTNPAFKR